MAHITTTGNSDVDGATSEIASALRHASPVDHGDQYFYDEAMRLRDAIMNGTRELHRAGRPEVVTDRDGDVWTRQEDTGLYISPNMPHAYSLDMLEHVYGPLVDFRAACQGGC